MSSAIMVVEPSQFVTDEERWGAIVHRNAAADGSFYYSVRTTGVYCRPSCPARLAKRSNVHFHVTCTAAEKAGFRPCRRCRPNEAPLAERQRAAIEKACNLIQQAEQRLDLARLAAMVGISRFHFH